jgi:hypothetical protein
VHVPLFHPHKSALPTEIYEQSNRQTSVAKLACIPHTAKFSGHIADTADIISDTKKRQLNFNDE